ncbi:MAG: serine hydrolase [Candidatus Saccharibacteria bacterium]|nr:serine hydrolase [Candidatus Saccharibacteria bacterium]
MRDRRLEALTVLVGIVLGCVAFMTIKTKEHYDSIFRGKTETGVIGEKEEKSESENRNENEKGSEEEDNTKRSNIVNAIDFQPIINEWVAQTTGEKGIIIYDLDLGVVSGSYHADEKFKTASLYKLFVVYEGYRRIQNGVWGENDLVGGTGFFTLNCLDLAIRESDSVCAESLWARIGYDELDRIVATDFGLPKMQVKSLAAMPMEIAIMLKLFYNHSEIIRSDLVEIMKDSFLNQPTINNHDWRKGLPSGFSERVKVYNKVGWEYNDGKLLVYNDAAIVEFADEGRHFIVVVMTDQVPINNIREFGAKLEEAFYENEVEFMTANIVSK